MAVVTEQELEDAAADCLTLEQVVNGAADLGGDGLAHPRLGGNIKTLAKIQADADAAVAAILEDLENSDLSTELYNAIKDDLGDNPNGDGNPPTVFQNLATLNSQIDGLQETLSPVVWQNEKFPLIFNNSNLMMLWMDAHKNRVTGLGFPEQELISKPMTIEDEAGRSPVYTGWDGILHNPAKIGGGWAFTKAVDIGDGDVQQVFVNINKPGITPVAPRQVTMLLENAYQPMIVQEGIIGFAMESGRVGMVWFGENALPTLSNNVDGIFQYGQSNTGGTVGGAGLGFQLPGVLIENPPSSRVLTFVGGIKTGYENDAIDSGDVASWVPATEQATAASAGGYLQVDSGLVNMGFYLINAQANKIFVSTTGFGGAQYADLKKGTTQYDDKLIEAITAAKALADAASVTFKVRFLPWFQGETEPGDAATYQAALEELQADFETDVKAITGQTEDIPLITRQIQHMPSSGTSVFAIAQGQLAAALANPGKIILACPQYQATFNDFYHLTQQSHIFMGSMVAKVARRHVYEGKPWLPLYPLTAIRTGRKIIVKFHVPVKPLVIDASFVTELSDGINKHGVAFVDSSMSAKVLGLKVISPDEIEIRLNKIPTGTSPTLHFAAYSATRITQGPATPGAGTKGLRCSIRDSDPEGCLVTGIPLHNYCVSSSIAVS